MDEYAPKTNGRLSLLASEAVEKQCNDAADECKRVADRLIEIGRRERERTKTIYAEIKAAVEGVRALGETFGSKYNAANDEAKAGKNDQDKASLAAVEAVLPPLPKSFRHVPRSQEDPQV